MSRWDEILAKGVVDVAEARRMLGFQEMAEVTLGLASDYPPIRDGLVRPVPYQGHPEVGDIAMVNRADPLGLVVEILGNGRQGSKPFSHVTPLWPRTGTWTRQVVWDALDQLVPVVPEFSSVEHANTWLENARPLQVGDTVRFQIPMTMAGPALDQIGITYQGTLVAIRHLDLEHWWRNRPIASGGFQVLWVDSDSQPHLIDVFEVIRVG